MKRLPVGLSSFGKLIEGNYVYVDKTALIYQMITTGDYYFLSRPRRFGKSLLVSTLEEIFSGNQQLFKDLWIGRSDYNWKKHPIIRLDIAAVGRTDLGGLRAGLIERLEEIAENYQVSLSNRSSLEGKFALLIQQLSKIEKVVILIDEYDKPILDNVDNRELAEQFRALLQGFYGVIKTQDQNIRFAFFTGVSKFTKTSIFSGLNNLRDITLSRNYAQLTGYTTAEIATYFTEHIEHMAQVSAMDANDVRNKIKEYYDGYRFAANSEHVYNPFSVLNCLIEAAFGSFWLASGTPTFLIQLLRTKFYDLDGVLNPSLSETDLDKFDVTNIPLSTLLFQTGYLTINDFNPETHMYTFCVPNREVGGALKGYIFDAMTGYPADRTTYYAQSIYQTFAQGSMAELGRILQQFLDQMPYHTTIKNEETLRALFFITFSLIGIRVQPEVATSRGRADLIVELRDRVYIIELKLDQPAQVALDQIQDREYYAKYQGSGKKITLVGLALDRDTRKIELVSKDI